MRGDVRTVPPRDVLGVLHPDATIPPPTRASSAVSDSAGVAGGSRASRVVSDSAAPGSRTSGAVPDSAGAIPVVPAHGSRAAGAMSLAAGVVLLFVSVTGAVLVGAGDIGLGELWRVLGGHLGLAVEPLPPMLDSLVWDLRMPRVLMAAVVGASLAICGAVLQSVTRNALAEPYLLGVSSGASTGAVLVVVLGVGGSAGVTGGALVGALASFALLLALLGRRGLGSVRVVLTGVVVGQLFAAITSLIIMASSDADTTRAITYWLLGSMAPARWESVVVTAIVGAIGLIVVWLHANALDGFAFGADTAASLGINVRRARITLLVVTALLTSVAVASVGAIGFVGLIVPHAVRFVVGPLHRILLPASALAGAIFLVWTDAVARIAFAPKEIPVGVCTALIGVPLFLIVLRRRGDL